MRVFFYLVATVVMLGYWGLTLRVATVWARAGEGGGGPPWSTFDSDAAAMRFDVLPDVRRASFASSSLSSSSSSFFSASPLWRGELQRSLSGDLSDHQKGQTAELTTTTSSSVSESGGRGVEVQADGRSSESRLGRRDREGDDTAAGWSAEEGRAYGDDHTDGQGDVIDEEKRYLRSTGGEESGSREESGRDQRGSRIIADGEGREGGVSGDDLSVHSAAAATAAALEGEVEEEDVPKEIRWPDDGVKDYYTLIRGVVQMLHNRSLRKETHFVLTQENMFDVKLNKPVSSPDLLPRKDLEEDTFNTCAFVGNSGMLLASEYGKAIDRHDVVMRVNQAPTRRYYRHVGKKTTYRLLNKKWVSLYISTSYGKELLLPVEAFNTTIIASRVGVEQFERLARVVRRERPDMHVSLLLSKVVGEARQLLSFFRSGMNMLGLRNYTGGMVPSSGFLGVYVLLRVCKHVSVYGISSEPSRKQDRQSWPYHYFTRYIDSMELRAHPHHTFDLEGDLVQRIAENVPKRVRVCRAPPLSGVGLDSGHPRGNKGRFQPFRRDDLLQAFVAATQHDRTSSSSSVKGEPLTWEEYLKTPTDCGFAQITTA
ncbi:hypothetical protein CBR_g49970 [Chara braunii]|uniref:beta-galactoside alpha-(2,6)-sialyltransferase n=1 Tax=Chara braunii TaxID=69332 RepID=A0A388K550_CHABU|nr:hypothetical protein CBR_g49970 [Chara braunii]|eukprot:GBG65177.1 hypothetical protein CBR_g49970 [Chara braunii]